MDPRQKREDETWAEYGARMAAMGVAPVESPMFAGSPVGRFRPPRQLRTPITEVAAAQAFPEPSFVQPSVVPSREVTGGFQDAMVPVPQQNIPQNVVPITPTDFAQAGMGTVDMPTFIPSVDIQPPIDVQTQIDTFAPRGDYAQVMADAGVAPVAPAPAPTVIQAPAARTPSPTIVPEVTYEDVVAPPVFVEPAYVAPAKPPPVDVAAVRRTVSAPAPFDFSGIRPGRMAEARRFAKSGQMGRAKQQIELGGGSWSKAMHLALRGETGMSAAELKELKNAAVNKAKLAREAEHAANVSAAQKKHAANVRAAKAKHAENVSVAELTRQATARQAFVAPVTDQDYIVEGTIPPGTSLDTRGDIFLDTQYTREGDTGSDEYKGLLDDQGGYTGDPDLGLDDLTRRPDIPTLPELQDMITNALDGWSYLDLDLGGFLFDNLRDERAAEKQARQDYMDSLDESQQRFFSGMNYTDRTRAIDAQIAANAAAAGTGYADLYGGGADDPTSAGFIDWAE